MYTEFFAPTELPIFVHYHYLCSLACVQLFVRLGKDWKGVVSPSKIAEEYILQYYGYKKETDLVVTVVHEDNEGERFWKWFKLQVRVLSRKFCLGKL